MMFVSPDCINFIAKGKQANTGLEWRMPGPGVEMLGIGPGACYIKTDRPFEIRRVPS